MKKAIAIVVAMLFVFAVASVSLAAEEKKAAPAPAEKKAPAKKQITGEVKSIDAKGKTITVTKKVKDKVEEVVISVDDKMLADVKAGDKVEVKYAAAADGKNTAKSITKKPEAKKAEPAKPVEPAKPAEPAKKTAPAKEAPGY